MDDQQLQALMDELSRKDDPHVMIVRYDDKLERIGTQAETVSFHTNPIQAVEAFYFLLIAGPARRSHHHAFLKNGQYLINWLNAHSDPQAPPAPNDLVDEVMSALTENLTLYHKITYLTIIPYLEYHTRDHNTLAWRIEAITDLPLVATSEYAYALDNEQSCINTGPDPQLWEGEMPSTDPLINTDALVMFDHDAPPVWVPPGEFSFLDDEIQAQLLPFETEPYTLLFAKSTPGPVPLPQANNAPPREIRDRGLSLDARRVFACTFPECSSRFTRPSDLRRHWINVHRGHTQQ